MDAALVSGMVVTQDYNYHNFRPEKPIARYEIALMTTRALGQVKEGNQLLDSLDYTDDNTILPWMKGYVNEAVKAGGPSRLSRRQFPTPRHLYPSRGGGDDSADAGQDGGGRHRQGHRAGHLRQLGQ